jgi:hypothetical protein
MVRKSYLVDQFYGQEELFSHYHLAGEGNLRGFVGEGYRGAEALAAMTSEVSLSKTIKKLNLGVEIAAFVDGGIFWDRYNEVTETIETKFNSRILGDAGVGFRFKTDIFEKDLFLRLDFPFYKLPDELLENPNIDWNRWIISFQRSI